MMFLIERRFLNWKREIIFRLGVNWDKIYNFSMKLFHGFGNWIQQDQKRHTWLETKKEYMGLCQSFIEQLKHIVFLHIEKNTITTNEQLACFSIMFQLVFTCTVESIREVTLAFSVTSWNLQIKSTPKSRTCAKIFYFLTGIILRHKLLLHVQREHEIPPFKIIDHRNLIRSRGSEWIRWLFCRIQCGQALKFFPCCHSRDGKQQNWNHVLMPWTAFSHSATALFSWGYLWGPEYAPCFGQGSSIWNNLMGRLVFLNWIESIEQQSFYFMAVFLNVVASLFDYSR